MPAAPGSSIQVPMTPSAVRKTADQNIVNNTFIDAADLSFPIGPNEKVFIQAWVPFSLAGIVSGVKFQLTGPAAPTNIEIQGEIISAAPGIILNSLVTAFAAPLATALALAGNHKLELNACIENGPNAGVVSLQAAQNVTDASALTILRGAVMVIIKVQ